MLREIKNSQGLGMMKYICGLEYKAGNYMKYPFGIRGYVIATK